MEFFRHWDFSSAVGPLYYHQFYPHPIYTKKSTSQNKFLNFILIQFKIGIKYHRIGHELVANQPRTDHEAARNNTRKIYGIIHGKSTEISCFSKYTENTRRIHGKYTEKTRKIHGNLLSIELGTNWARIGHDQWLICSSGNVLPLWYLVYCSYVTRLM